MPRRLDARAKTFASDFAALIEHRSDAEDDVSRDGIEFHVTAGR